MSGTDETKLSWQMTDTSQQRWPHREYLGPRGQVNAFILKACGQEESLGSAGLRVFRLVGQLATQLRSGDCRRLAGIFLAYERCGLR